ncbi:MAG: hypothetical protein GY925_22410 [Actinomycetia bacterium]|nr:hypothetical protein [Actinomycetes bacterium]
MAYVAAIDAGTTSIRVGLFSAEGERIGVEGYHLPANHPFEGAVEQDPHEMVDAARDLLVAVCHEAGVELDEVDALGITNQRGSVVAWDAETGAALHPIIGWQDTRTNGRVAELRSGGIPATTSAGCTKIEWLNNHDEACMAAAERGTLRYGTVDSWLMWRLSGGRVHATDPSNAGSTGFYANGTGAWSDLALDLFGAQRSTLGDIVSTDDIVGVTDALVVGSEIPLSARCGDQMASCLAHGLVEGQAKLTLGTSAMVDVALGASPGVAPRGAYVLPLYRSMRSGLGRQIEADQAGAHEEYVVEGSVHAAGSAVEWLVRLGLLDTVEHLDEVAALGRDGVDFLPALAGLGTPRQDPDVRAVFSGLSLSTTAADMVRGVLAGIAARVGEVCEVLGVEGELFVDGGLSQSDVLLQMIADVTDLRLLRSIDHETTLTGVARAASRVRGASWSPSYTQVRSERG